MEICIIRQEFKDFQIKLSGLKKSHTTFLYARNQMAFFNKANENVSEITLTE